MRFACGMKAFLGIAAPLYLCVQPSHVQVRENRLLCKLYCGSIAVPSSAYLQAASLFMYFFHRLSEQKLAQWESTHPGSRAVGPAVAGPTFLLQQENFLTEFLATAEFVATTTFTADAGPQSAQAANVLLSLRGSTLPPGSDPERLSSVPESRAAWAVLEIMHV
jgi:hypothetical protein